MSSERKMREGLTDIHCHIVPGVDDGASTKTDVKEMLQMEYDSGVRTLVLTPHYRKGMFEAEKDRVLKHAAYVNYEVQKLGLCMEVYLGCEYHANSEMIEELKQNPHFRINGGKHVLVEFSSSHSYSKIRGWIYQLVSSGFVPVIAHVERYDSVVRQIERVGELIELGALIQVSAGSLLGEYGFGMKRITKKLLKQRWIHFIGSDAHDTKKRRPNLKECETYVAKKAGQFYADELFVKNPQKILKDLD